MNSLASAMFYLSCLVIIMFFVGVYVGAEKAREKARRQYSQNENRIMINLERTLRVQMNEVRAGQKGIARLRKKIQKLQSLQKKITTLHEKQQNAKTTESTPWKDVWAGMLLPPNGSLYQVSHIDPKFSGTAVIDTSCMGYMCTKHGNIPYTPCSKCAEETLTPAEETLSPTFVNPFNTKS